MKIIIREKGQEFEYERTTLHLSNDYITLYNGVFPIEEDVIRVYLSPSIDIEIYNE